MEMSCFVKGIELTSKMVWLVGVLLTLLIFLLFSERHERFTMSVTLYYCRKCYSTSAI